MSNPIDWAAFGLMVRRARKERGLNQTQLGELVGYGQGAISKVELGKDTTTAMIDALVAELNLDLLLIEGPLPDPFHGLPEAPQVLQSLGGLPPTERALIVALLEALPRMPQRQRDGLLSTIELYGERWRPRTSRSTA